MVHLCGVAIIDVFESQPDATRAVLGCYIALMKRESAVSAVHSLHLLESQNLLLRGRPDHRFLRRKRFSFLGCGVVFRSGDLSSKHVLSIRCERSVDFGKLGGTCVRSLFAEPSQCPYSSQNRLVTGSYKSRETIIRVARTKSWPHLKAQSNLYVHRVLGMMSFWLVILAFFKLGGQL